MSEFKGTKGKWKQRLLFESPILVKDEENNTEWSHNSISITDTTGRIISEVSYDTDTKNGGWGNNETIEKWKANALLISKAPEMLEMLKNNLSTIKKLCAIADISHEDRGYYYKNIEKLITEATELN